MLIPQIRISVIVCVYNRQDFIGPCLTSILGQDKDDYELLIVDDGSTDKTSSIIRSLTDPKMHLIFNGVNKGMCYSRNQGIAYARGEIIVFTDSDCIVDPQWLSELIKPFGVDNDIMIVGGRIIDPPAQTYWEKVNNGMNHIAPASGYVSKIIGCNMAFQRQFLTNNLFDERLPAADEWDLCIRCERSHKKIFYTDKELVTHYHRSSLKSSLKQHFCFGYSTAALKIKHGQLPYFSYGTLGLLSVILCSFLGRWVHQFYYLAIISGLFYIGLTGYWNAWGCGRKFKERMVTYPGFVLVFLAFCLGNLYFPIDLIKQSWVSFLIKFSRK